MKREYVSMRYSDFRRDVWYDLTLVNLKDFLALWVPNIGDFAVMKAYFTKDKGKKVFDLSMPYYKWDCVVKAIPPRLREDLNASYEFQLMIDKKGLIHIQNWKCI